MITEADAANFATEVSNHPGRVLVDFHTPDCGPCRMMNPVLNELAQERGENLKFVKVDAAINQALAAQFRVSAMPTFILFENGQPKKLIVGARTKKLFSAWIDSEN